MPVKRRLSKGRTHRITPAAIEAFVADDGRALHQALGLKPWEQSPLDVDDGPPTLSRPGSAWDASYEQAQELRRLLRGGRAGVMTQGLPSRSAGASRMAETERLSGRSEGFIGR